MPSLRRCYASVVAAAAVCALAGAPASASAKDSPSANGKAPLRAGLEVHVSGLGAEGAALQERLDTEGGALLRGKDVLPRKTLDDGLITVEVQPAEGTAGGYHFDVLARKGDTTLSDTRTSRECVGCSEADVVAQVGAAIESCLPPLRKLQPAEPTTKVGPTEAEPETKPKADDRSNRAGLGTMGKVGVGVLVGGAAVAIVGVVFVVQGRAFSTEPGAATQEGHNFRSPGIGLLAGGVAATATGAVLLGIDVKRRRSRPSAALIPGGALVTLGGRF